MTIPIQMSLHGFIATAPQLNFTGNGAARFYARVGVEHYRKETDGSFTKLDSTVPRPGRYAKTAERAYSRFKVGDNFVASGYVTSTSWTATARARHARSSLPAGSATTPPAPATTSTARRHGSPTRRAPT